MRSKSFPVLFLNIWALILSTYSTILLYLFYIFTLTSIDFASLIYYTPLFFRITYFTFPLLSLNFLSSLQLQTSHPYLFFIIHSSPCNISSYKLPAYFSYYYPKYFKLLYSTVWRFHYTTALITTYLHPFVLFFTLTKTL